MALLTDVPKFGFGTAFDTRQGEITEENLKELLHKAIRLGCRHFDCAPLYGTQSIIGEVLRSTSIPRSEFFITSKLPVNMMHEEHAEISIRNTLKELQLSYLDLYLIHAPFATQYVSESVVYPLDGEGNLLIDETEGLLESTWKKLVDIKDKGFVKYIGLSNVNLEQLDRINKLHQVDVVQNEYHLYNQDREFFDYCEEIDVHYEAYAAFGCPPTARIEGKPIFMNDKTVARIAQENNLSNAQVIIQWLHQQPLSYVIRSDNPKHLEENINATNNMTLSINDMIDLDSLNQNVRLYRFDNYKGISRHREYPFKEHKTPLGEHKNTTNGHNEPAKDHNNEASSPVCTKSAW